MPDDSVVATLTIPAARQTHHFTLYELRWLADQIPARDGFADDLWEAVRHFEEREG
jgi:hypothetical protein